MSVLGRFLVAGRGSGPEPSVPLLVGAMPFEAGGVVSLDISRSVPDD